jgi:hypothetical protein
MIVLGIYDHFVVEIDRESSYLLPNEEVRISTQPNPWTRKRRAVDQKQEPVKTLVLLSAGLQHLGRRSANAEKPFNKSD